MTLWIALNNSVFKCVMSWGSVIQCLTRDCSESFLLSSHFRVNAGLWQCFSV